MNESTDLAIRKAYELGRISGFAEGVTKSIAKVADHPDCVDAISELATGTLINILKDGAPV